MTDGTWVMAGADRNGLRPMRYIVTGDGLMIAGSETGMVPIDEYQVVEKGALGPGQMIGVDMAEGRLLHDVELKDELANSRDFSDWIGKVIDLDESIQVAKEPRLSKRAICAVARLRRVTRLRNWNTILAPMADDGKRSHWRQWAMIPHQPCLSDKYRPLATSSGRTLARSQTRRSTVCVNIG